ncbi:hypothetical protein T492DRAFT_911599 [Pavlovales sp. CCMP2436]|nr:hypothetical protein T492DRAFT_911599 [Pavlovales sp. CCMP2436]
MYSFWYKVLQPTFGIENLKLTAMDTDCYSYSVTCESAKLYEEQKEGLAARWFDHSEFDVADKRFSLANKKRPGCFAEENGSIEILATRSGLGARPAYIARTGSLVGESAGLFALDCGPDGLFGLRGGLFTSPGPPVIPATRELGQAPPFFPARGLSALPAMRHASGLALTSGVALASGAAPSVSPFMHGRRAPRPTTATPRAEESLPAARTAAPVLFIPLGSRLKVAAGWKAAARLVERFPDSVIVAHGTAGYSEEMGVAMFLDTRRDVIEALSVLCSSIDWQRELSRGPDAASLLALIRSERGAGARLAARSLA